MKNMSSPISNTERLQALDLLRGIALFGILVVNALQYFQPLGLANPPIRFVPGDDLAWPIWGAIHALFDTKFLTIFSVLFGLGFALQWEKARTGSSEGFRLRYVRRMIILIGFGVIHGVFLYSADVLVVYGVAGLVLLSLSGMKPGSLMRGGVFIVILSIFVNVLLELPSDGITLRPILIMLVVAFGLLFVVRKTSPRVYLVIALLVLVGGSYAIHWSNSVGYASGADYQLAKEFREKQDRADHYASLDRSTIEIDGRTEPFPPTPEMLARIDAGEAEAPALDYLAYAAGDFALAIRTRIGDFTLILILGLVYFGWRTLGLFLIAAGLMKWGISGTANRTLWQKTAWIGLGLGIPISIINTVALAFSYQSENLLTAAIPLIHEISSLMIAAGLGSLAFLWADSSLLERLRKWLSGVGRMALTNYLGQSLIMSLVANGYGLGLYGRLTHLQLMVLSLGVFVLLAAVSNWWLGRFRYGPLEWLWRCGTYWRWLPFMKVATKKKVMRYD
ncbi:MAG TPA: DUF418 domain-containing protein [Xanthomonadales bacterium]|nr:DUF418 domain-containing protein [Xanthomonadales bacterium]